MGSADMPSADRARSGEHLVSSEEARAIAEDAADSIVSKALLSGEKDNGRRDAMLENVLREIRGLRNDIHPVIVTTAQHSTLISGIHQQIADLKRQGEETAKQSHSPSSDAAPRRPARWCG